MCVEPVDCYVRMGSALGSSKYWAQTYYDPTNSLSQNAAINPFADFNHVYVKYCSGDTHTGTMKTNDLFGFYFAGHLNLEAIVAHLKGTWNFTAADQVLLTGSSAGGIGTFNNANWLQSVMPNAVVRAAPISGLFFPRPTMLYEEWVVGVWQPLGPSASLYLTNFYQSYLDPACVAANPSQPSVCWDPGFLYPHISVDVLIANNLFDASQLQYLGWINSNSTNSNGFLALYGSFVNATILDVVNSKKPNDGVWFPSCLMHVENICCYSNTTLNGYLFHDLLRDWFFKENKMSHIQVDGCYTNNGLPCNKWCKKVCNG